MFFFELFTPPSRGFDWYANNQDYLAVLALAVLLVFRVKYTSFLQNQATSDLPNGQVFYAYISIAIFSGICSELGR